VCFSPFLSFSHKVYSAFAPLVAIAHDVDPKELVVFLPALGRKMVSLMLSSKGRLVLALLLFTRKLPPFLPFKR
jgi:hypothetical protein